VQSSEKVEMGKTFKKFLFYEIPQQDKTAQNQ